MSEQNIKFWDEPSEAPSASVQERLKAAIKKASELGAIIKEKADELAGLEKELADLKTDTIPSIMDEIGVGEVKLEDKTKITIVRKVNPSIKETNKREAFDWLVKNGFGGLIKAKITAEFGREEVNQAAAILSYLESKEVDATMKEDVHPQTLKAFVSERLEEGEQLPPAFTIFEYREAKITLPKGKK